MPTKTKEYYTVSEFAELTGYAVKTIRNMVNSGKLEAQKLPGCRKWMISRNQLQSFTPINAQKEVEKERKTTTIKVKNQEGVNDGTTGIISQEKAEESHQEKGEKGRSESQGKPDPNCGNRNDPRCPFEWITSL